MPQPNKNESKQDFLSRCTSELIKNEGRDSDQAYAMCNSYWDEAKGTRSALTLSAPFELAETEGKEVPKSFMITAYTGKVIDLGWFGKLAFDLNGMSAKEKIPILREHKRDRVVGFSNKAWKDEGHFFIGGDFTPSTQDGREVRDLAMDGFPWQASVGIWPLKVKVLDDEKESMVVNGQEVKGPAEIWTESKVGEVSFVALGADDQTAAIVLSDQSVPVEIVEPKIQDKEVITMTLDELKKQYPELVAKIEDEALHVGADTGRKEGAEAERARIKSIRAAAFDGQETLVDDLIEKGSDVPSAVLALNQDEKKKRQGELEKIKENAVKNLGLNQDDNTQDGGKPPEKASEKLAKIVTEKMERDKELPYGKALLDAQRENPELAGEAAKESASARKSA